MKTIDRTLDRMGRAISKPYVPPHADPNGCGQNGPHTAQCRAGLGSIKQTGTMGGQVNGAINHTYGYAGGAVSRDEKGNKDICGYYGTCAILIPDKGSVGLDVVLSTDKTTSGESILHCGSGALGVTASSCVDANTNSVTSTAGVSTSPLGANVMECRQQTLCLKDATKRFIK